MTGTVHVAAPASSARVSDAYRWTQLTIGVAAMVMIANYQYGWTFFVPDIQKTFGWDRASIQWAFTLFVLFETWLVPVEGWFVDKYGPRIVVLIGGILRAIGWAGSGPPRPDFRASASSSSITSAAPRPRRWPREREPGAPRPLVG